MVHTGLDQLIAAFRRSQRPQYLSAEAWDLVRGGRLGLVTNHAAVTQDLEGAPDALLAAGANLAALFGPEHGVRGAEPDGAAIASTTDPRTGLPVHSLYGETYAPTAEMLAGLDAILLDLQDVGARFYTYGSTMSHVMQACAAAGLPLFILDRPNPIGGVEVEGPLLEPERASFVGLHPIPIRHGCTLGELARLFHGEFGVGAAPTVVPCSGWRRADLWPATGRAWVPPSPAMPTPDTALVYPGLGMVEGTNLSEGRGTTRPFETVGAPWIDADALADTLNAQQLPGVRFRPTHFRPTASKHAGEACHGVMLHVTDPAGFQPVRCAVTLFATVQELYPEQFAWREHKGRYGIDRLAGSTAIRTAHEAGISPQSLATAWAEDERRFAATRAPYLIYD